MSLLERCSLEIATDIHYIRDRLNFYTAAGLCAHKSFTNTSFFGFRAECIKFKITVKSNNAFAWCALPNSAGT